MNKFGQSRVISLNRDSTVFSSFTVFLFRSITYAEFILMVVECLKLGNQALTTNQVTRYTVRLEVKNVITNELACFHGCFRNKTNSNHQFLGNLSLWDCTCTIHVRQMLFHWCGTFFFCFKQKKVLIMQRIWILASYAELPHHILWQLPCTCTCMTFADSYCTYMFFLVYFLPSIILFSATLVHFLCNRKIFYKIFINNERQSIH